MRFQYSDFNYYARIKQHWSMLDFLYRYLLSSLTIRQHIQMKEFVDAMGKFAIPKWRSPSLLLAANGRHWCQNWRTNVCALFQLHFDGFITRLHSQNTPNVKLLTTVELAPVKLTKKKNENLQNSQELLSVIYTRFSLSLFSFSFGLWKKKFRTEKYDTIHM